MHEEIDLLLIGKYGDDFDYDPAKYGIKVGQPIADLVTIIE